MNLGGYGFAETPNWPNGPASFSDLILTPQPRIKNYID